MARKKKQEDEGIQAGWINTFADLMNLLLCFFVLLFSMSTVDADKYEKLVTSMTESINVFDGGGKAVGEGPFVSSGTDQLVAISQFFNEFEEAGVDPDEANDQEVEKDNNKKTDANQTNGADGQKSEDGNTSDSDEKLRDKFKEEEAEKQKKAAEKLYGEVTEEARKKNIEDEISINLDKKYQYVQISLNGSILFDSGSAELKPSVLPLMGKVGDILAMYRKHMIKIEGHTDNVPISNSIYPNNTVLSAARAVAVFDYLREKKDMKPSKMEPCALGKYKPVADNGTEKGRARNRRVELKIYTGK